MLLRLPDKSDLNNEKEPPLSLSLSLSLSQLQLLQFRMVQHDIEICLPQITRFSCIDKTCIVFGKHGD